MNKQYRAPQHDKLQTTTSNRLEILETISSIVMTGAFDLPVPPYAQRLLLSVVKHAATSRQASQWQTATQLTYTAE